MKRLAVVIIAVITSVNLFAAYLKNVPVELKQPDGNVINCLITGDEFHRRVHDKDNYTIIQNPITGYYVFALKEGDNLIPSDFVVGKADPRQLGIEPNLDIPAEKMEEKRAATLKSAKIATASFTKGNLYNLVVFVRFEDDQEFTDNIESYSSRFIDDNQGANSVYNYYKEVSYGQLEVKSSFYPISENGETHSYQDNNQRNFYMPFSPSNPIGYKDGIEYTERKYALLSNALKAVKVEIENSGNLDGNDDGLIDNICFIIKGQPAGWGDLLWPHMSSFYDREISINGKMAGIYNLQIERALGKGGQGVLCHELFHSIGAPDLYHYNQDGNSPVGLWDIMEANANPPQHMCAYMKYKYGGWIQSIPEIKESGTYYLKPLTSSSNNCFRITSPNSSNEYFVVEYRKKIGTFENSLPDEGLLIYRINTAVTFPGNAAGPPDEVYIFRPQGSITNNGNLTQASFTSNYNKTYINDHSDPGTFLSDGVPGGLEISNIGALDDSITFTYKKGKPYELALSSPIGGEIFQMNSKTNITWINRGTSDIKIEYSLDDINWKSIDILTNQQEISDGIYTWSIPNDLSQKAKIRISNRNDSTSFSSSKSYFSITTKGRLFENEPNNQANLASEIELGDIFEGEISPEGDVDYFKFWAAKGDTLDFYAQALNSRLRGRIDIYSLTGVILGQANDYGGDLYKQRLPFIVPETGDYLLKYCRSNDPGIFPKSADISENFFQDSILNSTNSQSLAVGKYTITLRKFYPSTPLIQMTGINNLTSNSVVISPSVNTHLLKLPIKLYFGESTYYGSIYNVDNYPSTEANINISGLKPNTTYHYRVSAFYNNYEYFGGDQSFKTASSSIHWENQIVFENWNQIHYKDFYHTILRIKNDSMYILGYGVLLKTIDGGLNWEKNLTPSMITGDVFQFHHGVFLNMDKGWLVGEKICKTSDGGVTWKLQDNPTNKCLEGVSFSDEKNGIAVGWQGIILTTNNGGESWITRDTLRPDHSWFRLNDVQMINKDLAFAVGDFGTIIKTTDGGKSWTNMKTNFGTPHFNSLHFIDSMNGYIAVNNGVGLIHTFDGGNTWEEQNNASGKVQIGVNFYNKKKGIIVGKLGSIAVTNDGGKTWTAQESGYRDDLNDVRFIDSTKAVIVGNFQTILKTIDLSKREITLKSPFGGEVWEAGSVHDIIWQKNNVSKVNILFSSDIQNARWDTIATNIIAAVNSFKWLIPNINSQNCKIRIVSFDDNTIVSENKVEFTLKEFFTNQAPFANAGPDQSVIEGATVSLDGSLSSDPDGNPLTYKWTAPSGITLSSATASKPTFTAPEVLTNTDYNFTLTVNDGTIDSSVDQVVITVKQVDKAPIANAGFDQSVNEGVIVSLDGSLSADPDGNTLTYKWNAPTGITLSSTTVAKPTFTTPEILTNTDYYFMLVVNDGTVDSPADQVIVTVKNVNKAPVANAGSDQTVDEGATVTLDGSASSDPENDNLVYSWSTPSTVVLSDSESSKPTFTAPEVKKDSIISFSLIVSDGVVNSLPDSVNVTVLNVIKVGIIEIERAMFKIYPNPSTGIVNYEIENTRDKHAEIMVYNGLGEKVWEERNLKDVKGIIDLSNQVSGIYFIQFKTEREIKSIKLILRRD